MRQALALAARAEGQTRPNPPVGAVIVRGGRVVGRGFHARAGQPHAEVEAIRDAGSAARGATLYVTLEPCCTRGRTGPCTEAILQAGIRRVVAALRDPNPRHRGRGLKRLERAGVRVECGVLEEDASALIAPFAMWVTRERPRVTLKLAVTLDGRIADLTGSSRWISSPGSREVVQALRRRADAVLVGAGTVRSDDPSLAAEGRGPVPLLRIVADSAGRLPLRSRLLTDGRRGDTIVAVTERCSAAREARLRRCGAGVLRFRSRGGRVPLAGLMRKLGALGVTSVLCEGGGELAEALMRERLVDDLELFVCPSVLGGGGRPAIGGRGWPLAEAPRLRITGVSRVGPDVRVRAVPA